MLQTPFGQMLRPQLDQAMRGITQAPSLPASQPANPPLQAAQAASTAPETGVVHGVSTLASLTPHLARPRIVYFFTSASCAPCRAITPTVHALAAGLPSITFLQIDLAHADADLRARFPAVRATPTFRTVSHGDVVDEWSGADPGTLEANVRLLAHMAPTGTASQQHRHAQLDLPTLSRPHDARPILFAKAPPLAKLRAKLGDRAETEPVRSLWEFVCAREDARAKRQPDASVTLPGNCAEVMDHLANEVGQASRETESGERALFPVVDLLRLALLDLRVGALALAPPGDRAGAVQSGAPSLPEALLTAISRLLAADECPYALHLTALQALANVFAAPLTSTVHFLATPAAAEALAGVLVQSLLHEDLTGQPYARVRSAAAALARNAMAVDHARRLRAEEGAGETWRAEMATAVVEALRRAAESKEEPPTSNGVEGAEDAQARERALLLTLGLAAYGSSQEGEVVGVLEAVGARDVVAAMAGIGARDQHSDIELQQEVLKSLQ